MAKALVILFLFSSSAFGIEVGYSLTHQVNRPNLFKSSRGFEGRINFGGGLSNRYSGDRWSLAVGYINPRLADGDEWIPTPRGGYGKAPATRGYGYVNFAYRWYTQQHRFKHAPQLRFFIGTGVGYRDTTTCVKYEHGPLCWSGTPYVSSRWAFHETLGFKWRERLELACEHDSTGKISTINLGDDVCRFTLYPIIGLK